MLLRDRSLKITLQFGTCLLTIAAQASSILHQTSRRYGQSLQSRGSRALRDLTITHLIVYLDGSTWIIVIIKLIRILIYSIIFHFIQQGSLSFDRYHRPDADCTLLAFCAVSRMTSRSVVDCAYKAVTQSAYVFRYKNGFCEPCVNSTGANYTVFTRGSARIFFIGKHSK